MRVVITKGVGTEQKRVFEGHLPAVPREGESIEINGISMGSVHSIGYVIYNESSQSVMTAFLRIR